MDHCEITPGRLVVPCRDSSPCRLGARCRRNLTSTERSRPDEGRNQSSSLRSLGRRRGYPPENLLHSSNATNFVESEGSVPILLASSPSSGDANLASGVHEPSWIQGGLARPPLTHPRLAKSTRLPAARSACGAAVLRTLPSVRPASNARLTFACGTGSLVLLRISAFNGE